MVLSAISSKLEALSRSLDERVNLKHVHRRLQAFAKVLIVTTFFEDALRVLLTFSVQQNSMRGTRHRRAIRLCAGSIYRRSARQWQSRCSTRPASRSSCRAECAEDQRRPPVLAVQ